MPEYLSKNLLIVHENALKKSSQIMIEYGEEDNSFKRMLDVCDEYRAADLTPIVIFNLESGDMFCIVKELYGKKLH
jgi:hypothetical protein